jgi:hypothetical protein
MSRIVKLKVKSKIINDDHYNLKFWIDEDKILIDADVDKENVRYILEKLDNELQP